MAKRIKYENLTEGQKKLLTSGETNTYIAQALNVSLSTVKRLISEAEDVLIAMHNNGVKVSKRAYDTVRSESTVSNTVVTKDVTVEIVTSNETEDHIVLHKNDRAKLIEKKMWKQRGEEYVPDISRMSNECIDLVQDLSIPIEEVMDQTHLSRFAVGRLRREYVKSLRDKHVYV